MEPRDHLIFALDVDDIDRAERLVQLLSPHVGTFKVGSQLYTTAGPMVLDLVHGMGAGVFLDLKFHDIPATVGAAAREVARQRARMFTVHALGGRKMISSAARAMARSTIVPGLERPIILAVTILTSHTEQELHEIGLQTPLEEQSARLAGMAVEAGAGGVVASAREVPMLRATLPERTIFVTPGIRASTDRRDDQARVVTAKEAIEAGATYLVVGRPIRDDPDPAGAAQRILDDIASATPPAPVAR